MGSGKRRPNIRDISRQPPTDEERRAVRETMISADAPIVTAILGAALLEHELEQLLRPRFKRNDGPTWGKLTGDNGPLGTFSQKISIAYALGIADESLKDGLETVKNIRNQFAHAKKLIQFNHELIAKEIRGLVLPEKKKSSRYKDVEAIKNEPNPRNAFVLLCLHLYIALLEKGTARAKRQAKRMAQRSGYAHSKWSDILSAWKKASEARPAKPSGLYGADPNLQEGQSILGAFLESNRSAPDSEEAT